MLKVTVKEDVVFFGEGFSLAFERTLRLPDDGKTYPLPPGLGHFPVRRVEDYQARVPAPWREHGGVFIPMYQREALWIRFSARHWKPNAVKVAVGKINAVSGQPWQEELRKEEADYLVCPPQPWLDGINYGDGVIRQFVAMPLGMGYTVEAQITGEEKYGGIQIVVYEAKPGKFPDQEPQQPMPKTGILRMASPAALFSRPRQEATRLGGAEMGLGAGGKMKQKIYPDPHGIDTWDPNNRGRLYVHIVNSLMYREITGQEPPNTPVTAKTYEQYKLPWFDLYDDHKADIPAPEALQNIQSVKEIDEQKGVAPQQDDSSVETPQIITYKVEEAKDPKQIRDGKW